MALILDPNGQPVKRNFVHMSDLVEAMVLALDNPKTRQQTFNICMDEPMDYGEVAAYLLRTRGIPSVATETPYWLTWFDDTKAKLLLGWRPRFALPHLIDEAWSYERSALEPRRIWYPC